MLDALRRPNLFLKQTLSFAGQLKGALEHYGEAMHGRREVLGDKHPKTLQSIGKMEPWHPNSELR